MKSREHVVTNGRAVFYACMWEDFRKVALDCGWALGLHGSLNADMDIMAMPWTEDAKPIHEMLFAICDCFTDAKDLHSSIHKTTDKPNNRVVYTIPIWADFYLDINVIPPPPARRDEAKEVAVAFAKSMGFNYEYLGENKWQMKDNNDTPIIDVRKYSTEELYEIFEKQMAKVADH